MDDDDWDIQAVVKGCAASTVHPSSAVGIQEAYRDIPGRAHGVPPPVARMTNGNGIGSSSSPASVHVLQTQSNRQRRRKNQQMKVVREMTQQQLSTDSWAWRKYGQKPIKGSPYPRNYYRCSTSKGCAARKQVERSPNDSGLFLVSYTGEHTHPRPTHRSSLAGSTRAKSSTSTAAVLNASSGSNGELSSRNKGLSIAEHLKGGGSLFPTASPP